MISHITIDRHDARYDHHAGQAVLPVTVHHRDGHTEPTRLVTAGTRRGGSVVPEVSVRGASVLDASVRAVSVRAASVRDVSV
ncbi:hypothetical protein [Streptomyces malaysiensis]|uniref:hypothetical protein n=1 Tax=Streptomyces malaysiensis TaxID=92644 RepID=UPI002B3086DC|nr:hypothetical protein R8789_11670 [Streptomyces malaysiensis]